jgi:Carboxylesterase family
VSVQVNYRLSTLGFLAVPGTDVKGNFGIGDQITGLEVRELTLPLVLARASTDASPNAFASTRISASSAISIPQAHLNTILTLS